MYIWKKDAWNYLYDWRIYRINCLKNRNFSIPIGSNFHVSFRLQLPLQLQLILLINIKTTNMCSHASKINKTNLFVSINANILERKCVKGRRSRKQNCKSMIADVTNKHNRLCICMYIFAGMYACVCFRLCS